MFSLKFRFRVLPLVPLPLMSLVLWTLSMFFAPRCEAQVLLKPLGQNAAPLRMKTLQADVELRGQFAATDMTMVFQNETRERIEADFLLRVPPGAVVSYFAYWYGQEKVVARVVEKERAALIYKTITTRQRDPALVEMTGKNTLRARIFPVMPDADLRVQVRYVQTLPSDRRGAVYVLPLAPAKAGTGTLERLDIHVRAIRDREFSSVANNYGLRDLGEGETSSLDFSARSFRARRDFRVALLRPNRALQTSLYAARSHSSDGFFALALTPAQTMRNAALEISGVRTYEVLPTRLPVLRAGQVFTVVGRYRGGGPGRITLAGARRQTISLPVTFGTARRENNIAMKLWAARRLEEWGQNPKKRLQVVALSTRFGLPSRFTSWLAVPQEERTNFQREKAEADIAFYRGQIWLAMRQNQYRGETARELQNRFDRAARELGRDPRRELKIQLASVMAATNARLQAETKRSRPNRARVAMLRREMRLLERRGIIDDATARRRIYGVEQDLVDARAALEESASSNSPSEVARQRRLKQRVDVLARRYDDLLNTPALQSGGGGGGGFRSGDPLIRVQAPADATQVIAILPGGALKRLLFDAPSGTWQARFDIPTYASEGEYAISVILVMKDGERRQLTLRYRVDMSAPQGRGEAKLTGNADILRLELEASSDTTRVSALLPWGEQMELKPSTLHARRFFALAPIPRHMSTHAADAKAWSVTYILTDGAHNRTTIIVDAAR